MKKPKRRRMLPDDSWLIYRRGDHPVLGEYVQFLAMSAHRGARWDVLIREQGGLKLEIDQFSWRAFMEVPDVFAKLSEKVTAFRKVGDELDTLDSVAELLVQCGAEFQKG